MRDVNYGYLIRYIHANGASFFFICMYGHIGKALYYGIYKSPRVFVCIIGVIIFILTMATAFLGYKKIKTQNSPKSLINKIKYGPLINKRCLHTKTIQDIDNPEKIFNKLGIKVENYWENLHLSKTRENINELVKNKSGIYIIINKITGNKYIGSAITNKLHVRFANHCIHTNNGSKLVKQAIKKYGLNNFIFGIIEYYPEKITKYNNIELLILEQTYLNLLEPEYNILTEACNSFGYKHSEETLAKMKSLYTEDHKKKLREFQKSRKNKISQNNINRLSHLILNTEDKLSKIIYLKLNNIIICEFKNINKMSNYICCSERIIRRAISSGYIYIPIPYVEYLKTNLIKKYNNVKENNINIKKLNLKSGLVYKNKNLLKFEVTRDNN